MQREHRGLFRRLRRSHADSLAFRAFRTAAGTNSHAALASLVGVSDRTLWRWQRSGLNDTQADRAAVALGLHPVSVWPNWFNPDH